MALTVETRRDLAALASSSSLGKMPKPPPGYKQNRTKGFPLPDLDTVFGHVLNALGPEIATAKNQPPSEGSGADGGGSVGSKRARDPAADEGGGKRRSGDSANGGVKIEGASSEQGRSPMEVDTAGGRGGAGSKESKPGAAASSEVEPESGPPSDPVREGLEVSKKAFSRVLGVWEGVAMEGKRGLHQRVVARLGRILAEAEAAALAQESKASESEVGSRSKEQSNLPDRSMSGCLWHEACDLDVGFRIFHEDMQIESFFSHGLLLDVIMAFGMRTLSCSACELVSANPYRADRSISCSLSLGASIGVSGR